MKAYPALEVRGAHPDRLPVAIDDLSATAIEEREDSVRVFFSTATARDRAQSVLTSDFEVSALEVSDEDWARRSQENLAPVTVGRLTVLPHPSSLIPHPYAIVILPSMGFGTGHHATTRLCLAALLSLDLGDRSVLDVGTGSGVLAIAADRLGAARALGIDHDADAVQAARENLRVNPTARGVAFAVADLRTVALPRADVVTANLTGALLVQTAADLLGAVEDGGTLIVSGLLSSERDEVVRALSEGLTSAGYDAPRMRIAWEREEDGWVGLAVKKR